MKSIMDNECKFVARRTLMIVGHVIDAGLVNEIAG